MMNRNNAERIALKAAIDTKPSSAHTYAATVPLDHCYGYTAHGGFLVSIVLSATKQHFTSTLRSYKQPHTFDLHLMFLRAATAGQVQVTVEHVKLGNKISTVHVVLSQDGETRVVGHASNTNLDSEQGLSLPTNFTLTPSVPAADLSRLLDDADPQWLSWKYPWSPKSYLKAATHIRWFSPIDGAQHPSIIDLWLTPVASIDSFTTEMLGSIIDHWAEVLENYRPDSPFTTQRLADATVASDDTVGTDPNAPPFKYSTLSIGFELKKVLPAQGVQWLFLRAQVKKIRNGRLDAEIVVLDEKLELVAISHQVNRIVPGLGFTRKLNKL